MNRRDMSYQKRVLLYAWKTYNIRKKIKTK